MTHRQIYQALLSAASTLYPPEEARAVASLVAEELFDTDRRSLIVEPDSEVGGLDIEHFDDVCRRLGEGCPAQYLIGHCDFCGLRFEVTPAVLIPRPETEELVEAVAAEYNGLTPKVLDIGTGSGAIAIALAHRLPEAAVSAIDISAEALRVARLNAARNGVRVDFTQADIFAYAPEPASLDAIISNPPYITLTERAAMRRNVTDYEPAAALFVPDDAPLLFYRRIAEVARAALRPQATLWFEINERFGDEIAALLRSQGFGEVEVRRDMNHKPRIVRCRRQ